MPEFSVKEVRLPELHLPEIKREEIVRALSGIHMPNIDLTKVERGKLVPGAELATRQWREWGLSRIDLGKLIAAVVAAARFVRPAAPRSRWARMRRSPGNLAAIVRPAPRRSRRRFALVALVVAAVAGWAVLRNPGTRLRINRAALTARQRLDEMRADHSEGIGLDAPTIDEDPGAAQAETAASSVEAINPA